MGALETIDWDKLDGEIYSVIAHASAGTDFYAPDLQMAVDGCIDEMKRAIKAAVDANSTATETCCPACGTIKPRNLGGGNYRCRMDMTCGWQGKLTMETK